MKIHHLKKAMFPLCILALCLSLGGCDVSGEKIEPTATGKLLFQFRVTDPISFQVYVNDEPFDTQHPDVKYYPEEQGVPVRVMETVSKRVIFDGPFPVSPNGGLFYLTVYQHYSGSVPVCILPPEEESLPSAGYTKIAFLYNFPDFPNEIKAVVENSTGVGSGTYEPTDTLIVRKNEFSGFFLTVDKRRIQVKLYTADDNSTPIGMVSNDQFLGINHDFTMYLAKDKSGSVGSELITLEKAY